MAPHPKEGDQLVKAYHNKDASLCHHTEKLMVKVSGPLTGKGDTARLDIVFVLDTSGSMRGNKLEDMKRAMTEFIVHKLGDRDGLAIIPFNSTAPAPADKEKRFTALSLNRSERQKAVEFVRKLRADGNTNIEAGLKAGLEYLDKGRRGNLHNASCIFLMSDGHENVGKASNLDGAVADHSVVTFGFGEDSDEKLLYGIASKSHAGTYHHVREKEDQNKLMTAFAGQLAIYRSISMLGLKVTLRPNKDAGYKILGADAGSYKREGSKEAGYIRISFGDLARQENRRILVDLELPKVEQEQKGMTVMHVEYEYSPPKKARIPGPKHDIKMNRVRNPAACQAATDPNVTRELVRRAQADHLYKVMYLADNKNMGAAIEEAENAKNSLSPVQDDQDEAVDALVNELDNIEEFLGTYDVYHKLGRAYLLACISSHERQRFTSRGGAVPVDLFRTPRMDKYLAEARKAHKNRKP